MSRFKYIFDLRQSMIKANLSGFIQETHFCSSRGKHERFYSYVNFTLVCRVRPLFSPS